MAKPSLTNDRDPEPIEIGVGNVVIACRDEISGNGVHDVILGRWAEVVKRNTMAQKKPTVRLHALHPTPALRRRNDHFSARRLRGGRDRAWVADRLDGLAQPRDGARQSSRASDRAFLCHQCLAIGSNAD